MFEEFTLDEQSKKRAKRIASMIERSTRWHYKVRGNLARQQNRFEGSKITFKNGEMQAVLKPLTQEVLRSLYRRTGIN